MKKETKEEQPVFSALDNLLMNMTSGLKPEDLTETEIQLLEANFGMEWMEKLGYSADRFNKPKSK